jgi:hypothetical protein
MAALMLCNCLAVHASPQQQARRKRWAQLAREAKPESLFVDLLCIPCLPACLPACLQRCVASSRWSSL